MIVCRKAFKTWSGFYHVVHHYLSPQMPVVFDKILMNGMFLVYSLTGQVGKEHQLGHLPARVYYTPLFRIGDDTHVQ